METSVANLWELRAPGELPTTPVHRDATRRSGPSARKWSGTPMIEAASLDLRQAPRQRHRHPVGTSMENTLPAIARRDRRAVLVQAHDLAAGQIP